MKIEFGFQFQLDYEFQLNLIYLDLDFAVGGPSRAARSRGIEESLVR